MMREKLESYVNLLFAGYPEAGEIRQEILQNTLDRYDDLVASGKSPEAAYSLAISGIGDITELMDTACQESCPRTEPQKEIAAENPKRKLLRAIAVTLYILCPVPLFIFQNEAGLCLLLVLVAVATMLMVLTGSENKKKGEDETPQSKSRRAVHNAVVSLGTVLYFVISFATGAWFITWVIFILIGVVNNLIDAFLDLGKEK